MILKILISGIINLRLYLEIIANLNNGFCFLEKAHGALSA